MKTSLIIILLFTFNISFSKDSGLNNVIGKTHTIQSKALNESREIKVYLPESYDKSEKDYPVVYIIDGQKFFLYGVSLQRLFNSNNDTPDFIVVGITNASPARFGHFSSGASQFIQFIEKDVLSFVDKNYRTSQTRLLFGWEYAGALAVQIMTEFPQLFSAYIVASPYPIIIEDSTNKSRLSRLKEVLSKAPNFDPFLFFSVSQNEEVVNDGTEGLNSLLLEKSPKSMDWSYKILMDEEHSSTPFSTLYQGIKKYYATYPVLYFQTLDKYHQAGGMQYVEDYYKTRAKKYGFSPEILSWTKYTLVRSAMRGDDFIQFESLMKVFNSNAFLSELRESRTYEIAEYYEKNKKFNKAIDIYTLLMNKSPDSVQPLISLGDVYTLLKDKSKADDYYSKAEELKVQKTTKNTLNEN